MKCLARLLLALTLTARAAQAQGKPLEAPTDTVRAQGLNALVQVIRDRWGINHIYAYNDYDLFFTQGYMAAHDRLFQFELWRRQATGTVAELLGPRELKRDIGARLFAYRGDMSQELAHYHSHSRDIIQAFVDGVNAYIDEANRHPDQLPIEFKLLGTRPHEWTADVVVSRHQGLLGNIQEELNFGRAVAAVGDTEVKRLAWFHPWDPDLKLDKSINGKLLSAPILDFYEAFRKPVQFEPTDIVTAFRNDPAAYRMLAAAADSVAAEGLATVQQDIGSNNWVVSGRLTASGKPIMANDPHRAQSVPSLRSWVHLVAPGWDVIGGGEPEIPGVSVGHNEYGAWGLTIFATDGEDLYVYQTNPEDPNQYMYHGAWEPMRLVREPFSVKGQSSPVVVRLRFTRHGPVVYQDSVHHVAYAVRAAWLEPGSAPYLASLRMDQAHSWDDFRNACSYAFIPGENMVWADAKDIGWQAVGIAPVRQNWSGLVPVPGDGRFEWQGYLRIPERPHELNPPAGYIATANNDLIPSSYPYPDAVGYVWADPYRWDRITDVLGAVGHPLSVSDMTQLQTDYLSIPARQLVPLLASLSATSPGTEAARRALLDWNFVLDKNSIPAGIYEAWYRRLEENTRKRVVPEAAQPFFPTISTHRLIEWLTLNPTIPSPPPPPSRAIPLPPSALSDGYSPYVPSRQSYSPSAPTSPSAPSSAASSKGAAPPLPPPPPKLPPPPFGENSEAVRDSILLMSLDEAVADLTQRFGTDYSNWKWGQNGYHHALIMHPLSAAVSDSMRSKLDVGPVPRGGDGNTVGATGGTDNQLAGASFRIVADVNDWDASLGSNNPGQSGDPDSSHYRDLFALWSEDQYFPVTYSRPKVEAAVDHVTILVPPPPRPK
jgi:penicillin amidase